MSKGSLDFLFHPKSIAVVGASSNPERDGHSHLKIQTCYGFKGELYPINPKQTEVSGLKAYPSLEDVPGTIDHVICAVGINNVPDLLTQASRKGAKTMHIYAGRASETGRPDAKKLDEEILSRAREYGIRIVGPNALGLFCPKSGLSFGYDFPSKPGNVGAMIQSGANATQLCHFAALRGVEFSKVVSYGNALDINEIDLLEYFSEDPETKVLLCYIEGFREDPQKYLELVHKTAQNKPVIICKGGRSKAGVRFSLGHNASRAEIGSETWGEPIRKTGAILVKDIDELLDMAVAFSKLAPIKGNRIGAGGGGGGDCVLYSDAWEENGFELPPLPQAFREEFKRRGSQIWDWINNPADFSIVAPNDAFTIPAALAEMAKYPDFDFIVGYVGEDYPFTVEILHKAILADAEGYINTYKESDKPFFAIICDRPLGINELDGKRYRVFAEIRTRFIEEGVPFFTSVEKAARSIREQMNYYQRNS